MKIIEISDNIKNNLRIQGIYVIVNKINWKVYIGHAHISKKYNGIGERFYDHVRKLKRGNHSNKHLQYAWNKYGDSQFIYIILEEVDNADDLVSREQFWMDQFNSHNRKYGYNTAPAAGSVRGIKYGKKIIEKFRTAKMKQPPNKHLYKGICFHKGKWLAGFKKFSLGIFDSIEEAAKNYDYHVLQLYGRENCYLNFPNYDYSNFIPKRVDLSKHIPVSKYIGVSKLRGKWRAFSNLNGSNKHLGTFAKEKDAAKRYDYFLIQNNKPPVNFPKYDYSLYTMPNLSRESIVPRNKYKGVTYYKKNKAWGARINYKNKSYFIGIFSSAKVAAKHYDYYALKLHGKKAYINFPKFDYSSFMPEKLLNL